MTELSDNVIKFPGEAIADIEATAALWLTRMTSGALTLGDLAEFEYWRAAAPEHDRIYREMQAMWDGMATADSALRLRGAARRRFVHHDAISRWALRIGQIAAAIVAVVAASQYLSTWRYDYHTAPGEIRQVALADGSVVTMKGGTAFNAQVSATGARTIELARGEAFFEVKHDAARPFTVAAGSGAVRDVGTGFSVTRTGGSATVAVEHGAVAVLASGRSDTLTRGQQVSFDLYDMGTKLPVDTGMISPWRRGLYVAKAKPLGEVLGDLNEYYSGHIVVIGHALAARRVNAVIQLDHIGALLDSLDQARGVSVRHWGPLTIVSDSSG